MKDIKDRLTDPEKCFHFKNCERPYYPRCDGFGNLDMGVVNLKCHAYVSRQEEYNKLVEMKDVEAKRE